MHVIESIGPVLGIAAFLGLAVLAFLLFHQSRDLRRLREWAGRAPERAQEAADAVQAAADATRQEASWGEPADAEAEPSVAGRLGGALARGRERSQNGLRALDRRLPVDGRYLLALAGVAIVAVAVLTSGFGLLGGGGDSGNHKHHAAPRPKVAVLNGTAVTGLADLVDKKVIKPAGYKAGVVTNTASSFANTVVMYDAGGRSDAKRLTAAIKPKLGETPVQAMTPDVKARAGNAPLALAVGLDDAGFGTG
ncbi:MAG: LytR C-terminal domain-containing protein [Solirubrobacterales bacterium]